VPEARPVDLYFDFISPYAYLALTQVEAFGARHDVDWQLRPVLYGALLDATGLIGPVEVASKRRYTLRDISRTAQTLGVPLVGPPAHPFRSLTALRTMLVFADRPEALRLTVALASACWADGEDLTDIGVLRHVVEDLGLPGEDLAERAAAGPIKAALRDSTEEALRAGVFGVPTFGVDGELFWGHDRMDQLGSRLAGTLAAGEEQAASMESRPRGADRTAAPLRREPVDS